MSQRFFDERDVSLCDGARPALRRSFRPHVRDGVFWVGDDEGPVRPVEQLEAFGFLRAIRTAISRNETHHGAFAVPRRWDRAMHDVGVGQTRQPLPQARVGLREQLVQGAERGDAVECGKAVGESVRAVFGPGEDCVLFECRRQDGGQRPLRAHSPAPARFTDLLDGRGRRNGNDDRPAGPYLRDHVDHQ